MTVTYANAGYVPIIFTSWYDPTANNSSVNDCTIIALNSVTATTAKFYIEATSGTTQNGTIYV